MAKLTVSDLEIERNDEAFEIDLEDGSKPFTFSDPKGIQADLLIKLEALPVANQLRAVLGPRADEFLEHPAVDGYVMEAVLARYNKHYGLGTPPEEQGSARLLKDTPSRSKRTSPGKGSR